MLCRINPLTTDGRKQHTRAPGCFIHQAERARAESKEECISCCTKLYCIVVCEYYAILCCFMLYDHAEFPERMERQAFAWLYDCRRLAKGKLRQLLADAPRAWRRGGEYLKGRLQLRSSIYHIMDIW